MKAQRTLGKLPDCTKKARHRIDIIFAEGMGENCSFTPGSRVIRARGYTSKNKRSPPHRIDREKAKVIFTKQQIAWTIGTFHLPKLQG